MHAHACRIPGSRGIATDSEGSMTEGVRWNYKEYWSYDEAELTLEVTHLFHKFTQIQGDRSV
eukprot:SAG11_NODE_2509_length_3270_cov_4.938190_3_plen_62_part_00